MNVQTLQMDKYDAAAHWHTYRKSVRAARELRAKSHRAKLTQIEREEDDLRAAYRAMALGQRVIVLPSAIRATGFNELGLPKLAVARATWEWCRYESGTNTMTFRPDDWRSKAKMEFLCPLPDAARHKHNFRALVPPVPPQFRPERLENYHILWEAEWAKCPPLDPILLKQISATVYLVVAQWDLTPVERAVLEGRFA